MCKLTVDNLPQGYVVRALISEFYTYKFISACVGMSRIIFLWKLQRAPQGGIVVVMIIIIIIINVVAIIVITIVENDNVSSRSPSICR